MTNRDRSRRELAGDDGEGLDVDRRFVIGVPRVEVRPAEMVDLIVIHPDHNPVESTDSGHRSMMARPTVEPAASALGYELQRTPDRDRQDWSAVEFRSDGKPRHRR